MILNVKRMYTRNRYTFKQENRKIYRSAFLSCPVSYMEKIVIWSFSRSKTQNGQIMRQNLFRKYVLFNLTFHHSHYPII